MFIDKRKYHFQMQNFGANKDFLKMPYTISIHTCLWQQCFFYLVMAMWIIGILLGERGKLSPWVVQQ